MISVRGNPCSHLTIAQRTIRIENLKKTRIFYHAKPFPLEIKTIGDMLMVRRKQAGLSHRQLAAKTGFSLHWFRRWEYDRCVPSQAEWDAMGKLLDLPPKPVLTFAQPQKTLEAPKTIGQHLRQRRLTLKLCLAEAAPQMGVSVPTLGLWELGRAFPKHRYHEKIVVYLGYNPFPK